MAFRGPKTFSELWRYRAHRIKLKSALQRKEDKIENLRSSAHAFHCVVERTITAVECDKIEKCICKACKNTVFHFQIWKFMRSSLP